MNSYSHWGMFVVARPPLMIAPECIELDEQSLLPGGLISYATGPVRLFGDGGIFELPQYFGVSINSVWEIP